MNVVQLTASRSFGSVERQMLGLAESLPCEFRNAFISFSEGGRCTDFLKHARKKGYYSSALEFDTPRLISAFRELTILLRDLETDVLCCRGYKANLLGRLAARKLGIPVFAVSHGWTSENLKVRAYEALECFGFRFVDRVVCVSHSQAEKVCRKGVARERVVTIPDAVQIDRFSRPDPGYRQAFQRFFTKPPSRIVGAAGRLSREKGFGVLVEAASRLKRTNPDIGFVLFGDGMLRDRLSRQIAANGLNETFVLPGFRADLDQFLPYLDLVALPSFTEGLPNVVLEAFAAAVPVVASAVGGTPEIVQPGVNGLLVPPGNPEALAQAIRNIFDSESRRKEMGRSGRELIRERFSFKTQSLAYQELFRSLVPRRDELCEHQAQEIYPLSAVSDLIASDKK
jgi:glycosyltransferase involved in cell wall biosynthesis